MVQNSDWFYLACWENGLPGCGGFLLKISRDGFSLTIVIYHNHPCSLGTGTICVLVYNTITDSGNVTTLNELEGFTQSNLTWIVMKVPHSPAMWWWGWTDHTKVKDASERIARPRWDLHRSSGQFLTGGANHVHLLIGWYLQSHNSHLSKPWHG